MSLEPFHQYSHALFTPDILAGPEPSQVRDGIWLLTRALLQRNIADLAYPQDEPDRPAPNANAAKARSRQAKQNVGIRAQALAWIADDDEEHPFSFVPCCERLGLAPDFVRRLIRAGAVVRDGRGWA